MIPASFRLSTPRAIVILGVLFTTIAVTTAATANATVTIHDGLATVVARNATVAEVLAEWSRVGGTAIVNGEKMSTQHVTLELIDVPEKQALDTVLPGEKRALLDHGRTPFIPRRRARRRSALPCSVRTGGLPSRREWRKRIRGERNGWPVSSYSHTGVACRKSDARHDDALEQPHVPATHTSRPGVTQSAFFEHSQ